LLQIGIDVGLLVIAAYPTFAVVSGINPIGDHGEQQQEQPPLPTSAGKLDYEDVDEKDVVVLPGEKRATTAENLA
jgi:hypothetical protein